MAEYDLTQKIAPFTDVHFLVQSDGPLDFLIEQAEYYSYDDVMRAKLALLAKTKNVDGQLRALEELQEDIPPELEAQQQANDEREEVLREAAGDALDMFSLEDMTTIKEYVTAGATDPAEKLEMKEKLLAALPAYYDYAKFKYERGEYDDAYLFLNNYIQAIGDRAAFSTVRYSHALWGRLGAVILTQQWHLVKDAVEAIDKHIMTVKRREDGVPPTMPSPSDPDPIRSMSDREKLQLRTWVLHWCLFAYPVTPDEARKRESAGDKWENILELIFPVNDEKQGPGNGPDRYRQAVQNNAPWLLRYVTTMVILHKRPMSERFRRKQDVIKEVIWLIEQEAYTYQDPITQFLQCLYVRFDFDGAQEKLQACYHVLRNDYFLSGWADAFLVEARQLIFETYCRIHQKIDINMLGQKLGMSPAEAEKWIVDLILDSKLVAKIDSRDNYVEMNTRSPSVYHQVLDRTERLASSTFRLGTDTQKIFGQTLGGYPDRGATGGRRGRP
ncbi:eukaryotic translation initiation factor 3 subunit e [Nannochloropsis gaditana]|uniref:Eukaryotic translation initiation factor 3 subunit E n=1 Tax=Nannochloropsis gaditana TaxID=72520 RepID=W7TKC0_9STRA|nr:eukaryotic translation initiation factor 3 subunit e [Nannochloropsis gaditana]